jgi:rod shape determining protein RodA
VLWRGLRIALALDRPFGRSSPPASCRGSPSRASSTSGMTLGIMPVTGLPLPFVSYGGSAMFATSSPSGLLQNVHMRSREL